MSTPLIFKALLMLAFGLRLFKNTSKIKKEGTSEKHIIFFDLPERNEIFQFESLKENYKYIYRNSVRNNPFLSKDHYLIYLGYNLEKSLGKGGGIYRFLWFNSEKSISLLQILDYLHLDLQKQKLSQILKFISPEKYSLLENGIVQQLDPQTFVPEGDLDENLFREFDQVFTMDSYWTAAEKLICSKTKNN